ncbi:Fe-S cluster assembly protein HesB [Planosporangium flavigriseum]|uniref:HhH-GPD-type base excision DNA repair protein n=1 Tax=Planosporangium flavigriseum TaxID=373681 RepID=UPI00143A76E4|nr:Fe-S cluster assembly protein HesB [Planosporangium flavigriseum]
MGGCTPSPNHQEVTTVISLPIEPAANELLSRSPLALLIGMVLDQQIPLERAFSAPYDLVQRFGHEPDARELAEYDPEALTAVFAERPALHRFPKAMAARVQQVCQLLVERYDGDTARLWTEAKDGKELLKRVAELPGFGKQKAQIFTALLGKQYGVQPQGWREAAGAYGEEGSYRSVADIVDETSLVKVRSYKQQMKAAAAKAAT